MALHKPAPTILVTAVLLATAVADLGALAQDRSDSAIDSAIATALRTGDFRQTAVFLERMAKVGNAAAQYQLGSLYRSGRGVPQDDALAFQWMKAAAEHGHVRAQFNLGSMYLTGRGVARDLGKGRTWLEKAAAMGYEDASRILEKLPAQLAAEPTGSSPASPAASGPQSGSRQAAERRAAPLRMLENGRPLILDAAIRGQADVIRQMIASGANVMAKDGDGNTPSHWPRLPDSWPR